MICQERHPHCKSERVREADAWAQIIGFLLWASPGHRNLCPAQWTLPLWQTQVLLLMKLTNPLCSGLVSGYIAMIYTNKKSSYTGYKYRQNLKVNNEEVNPKVTWGTFKTTFKHPWTSVLVHFSKKKDLFSQANSSWRLNMSVPRNHWWKH